MSRSHRKRWGLVLGVATIAGCNLVLDNRVGVVFEVAADDGGRRPADATTSSSSGDGASSGGSSGALPPDAGPDGASSGATPRCLLSDPWQTIGEQVAGVQGVEHAWLVDDERTLYFSGTEGTIFRAERTDTAASFTNAQPLGVPGVRPLVTDDERFLFVTSATPSPLVQQFEQTDSGWSGATTLVPSTAATPLTGSLRSTLDGKYEVWLHQQYDNGTLRAAFSRFDPAPPLAFAVTDAVVTNLGVEQDVVNPVISSDGMALYFTLSLRAVGQDTPGPIMHARRDMPDGTSFTVDGTTLATSEAGVLEPHPNWISKDECRLYYSDRVRGPNEEMSWQLFVLRRQSQ